MSTLALLTLCAAILIRIREEYQTTNPTAVELVGVILGIALVAIAMETVDELGMARYFSGAIDGPKLGFEMVTLGGFRLVARLPNFETPSADHLARDPVRPSLPSTYTIGLIRANLHGCGRAHHIRAEISALLPMDSLECQCGVANLTELHGTFTGLGKRLYFVPTQVARSSH